MKAKQDKWHFMSSIDISTKFLLSTSTAENLRSQKYLDVTIDRKLNFNKHVTSRETQVLACVFPYIVQK